MFDSCKKKFILAVALAIAMAIGLIPQGQINAADHNDSSIPTGLPGADLLDVYAFNDPGDNSNVVLAMDVDGFVVPSEIGNTGFFSPDVTFQLAISNTGNAKPNLTIDVTFSPRTSTTAPQTATVKFSTGQTFTAPTTVTPVTAATPPPFVVTTDPKTGIQFFAGFCEDPFFFDIIGFNRFVASVEGGAPDPTQLQRGRNSFAGYDVHMIAMDIPFSLLKGTNGSKIAVEGATLMHKKTIVNGKGDESGAGKMVQIDREGNPAVNTVFIPFAMKDEYNASTPEDDAAGKFAPAIVATLTALGTNAANQSTLAGVAITSGDYLHLDNSIPNSTLGVGETIEATKNFAGFPNGRRPGDDVVNTLIFLVTNETITTGDNVPAGDGILGTTFPFFAPPKLGQAPGASVGADGTQN
jgi:hypothetical protein